MRTSSAQLAPEPQAAHSRSGLERADQARIAAEAEVAAARQCLESLQMELSARRKLFDAGVMAEEEVERFALQVSEAQREWEAARRRLAALGPSPPVPSADSQGTAETQPSRPNLPTPPPEMTRLAAPRWQDYLAPSDGVIVRQIAKPGQVVKAGDPLLEAANTNWAYLYAYIPLEVAWRFSPNTPVTISFDDYPGVCFQGWIESLGRERDCLYLRAEIRVYCASGYYGDDAYATLLWLAFAAPVFSEDQSTAEPLQPARLPVRGPDLISADPIMYAFLPSTLLEHAEGPYELSTDIFVGPLSLVEVKPAEPVEVASEHKGYEQRLSQLRQWRESFVEGMTTTVFDRRVVLTYPRRGEITRVIERMARAEVSHYPNLCALTMRQALGWGLGDAHTWATRLPERGYKVRQDGIPRPGDILVWPFTYGPHRNQHIGVAVQQNGKMMLLSNLSGTLGTTDILGGYIAFYKPDTDTSAG